MGITLNKLYPGKLDHELLREFIEKYTTTDERVVQGARIGEDATVIDIGDRYLVVKTDPVTFVTDAVGAYAVYVNANDIACMGATPKWFMAAVLLPETATRTMAETIFADISKTCSRENIVYCGGHTEVMAGLAHPVVVGHMLGEADKTRLLLKSGVAIGDHLILINHIPIEGTTIIGREKSAQLEAAFSKEFVQRCKNYFLDPGISILPAARTVQAAAEIHALHDPTEGGLATAIHELALAADLGVVVYREKIHLLSEGKMVCDFFNLDPLGVIASGALLCAAPLASVETILAAFEETGIPAADIGRMIAKEKGVVLVEEGKRRRMPLFAQDEVLKIFV
jgi:hydrogenase expression/formation protein HypE